MDNVAACHGKVALAMGSTTWKTERKSKKKLVVVKQVQQVLQLPYTKKPEYTCGTQKNGPYEQADFDILRAFVFYTIDEDGTTISLKRKWHKNWVLPRKS